MEKNFEYNTNIKERTRQNYIWIKKCNTLYEKLKEIFDFRPNNIIEELNLKNVSYKDTTLYSHFGKDNLPWEKLNKVELLKEKFHLG